MKEQNVIAAILTVALGTSNPKMHDAKTVVDTYHAVIAELKKHEAETIKRNL
jgi:hypothetical protein